MNGELSIKKFKKVGLDFTSFSLIFAGVALLIVQFNWWTSRACREDIPNTFPNGLGVWYK